ncbi:endopolyphosphatase [Gnomoniopsis sp. IMI 355080]|nr:endopolyphosphatase [Gnomoniopsis sp. IMI 355080]
MANPPPPANVRQALESASAHYLNLIEFGILKVFIDFNVFDNIPDSGDISIAELAQLVGGQASLLQRFSDYLVASEILTSQVPGRIAHTSRSMSYRSSEIAAGFVSHVYHLFLRPMATWSTYFEKNGLAEPKDARTIPLGLGTGHPDLDLYGVLDAEPKLAVLFNSAQARSASIYSFKGLYDFGWMRTSVGTGRPAIVDVGGSHGLALLDILEDNLFISPEQCAVFDLPQTVRAARSNTSGRLASSQFVAGDMLETLPEIVRGAVVYLFRRVLSDFVDMDIVTALKRAREASVADSRVLIVEELVKPTRSKFAIAQDISVLNFGGKRRSERMWHELAEKAGYRVKALFEDDKSEYAVLGLVAMQVD